MLQYLWHEQDPRNKKYNALFLKEEVCKEFYAEIDRILPHLTLLCAAKKKRERTGAYALRSGATPTQPPVSIDELDKAAKEVWNWLDTSKLSHIRRMVCWKSCAGGAFVADCHHRAAQCFKYHGNAKHEVTGREVSLQEFQAAIVSRHRQSSIEAGQSDATQADFEGH